jgi:hypothetical protein
MRGGALTRVDGPMFPMLMDVSKLRLYRRAQSVSEGMLVHMVRLSIDEITEDEKITDHVTCSHDARDAR